MIVSPLLCGSLGYFIDGPVSISRPSKNNLQAYIVTMCNHPSRRLIVTIANVARLPIIAIDNLVNCFTPAIQDVAHLITFAAFYLFNTCTENQFYQFFPMAACRVVTPGYCYTKLPLSMAPPGRPSKRQLKRVPQSL